MQSGNRNGAATIVVLALLAALTGCDDSSSEPFALCGNGILDRGEQCDDGNLADNDDCLSTCVIAICGDGFVNVRNEDCDRADVRGKTCYDLGYQSGSLSCTVLCDYDTSSCVARPTATATKTATSPPSTDTPTRGPTEQATPTSTPIVRCEQVHVTVSLDYDDGEVPVLAGVTVDLDYASDLVDIPGTGSEPSVRARVTDLSGASGFFQVNDRDTNDNGEDDQLRNAYASSGTTIPPAEFAAVLFDCRPGEVVPEIDDFTCTVAEASDQRGFPVEGVTCTIELDPTLTATPTPTNTVPVVSPTATEAPRCQQANVVVSIDYDRGEAPSLAGLTLDLDYRPNLVEIPGSGSDPSVRERVIDLTGAFGFFQLNDLDTNDDGSDDRLRSAYATAGSSIPPAEFVSVLFDCQTNASIPTETDFSCSIPETSDARGFPIEAEITCTTTVEPLLGGPAWSEVFAMIATTGAYPVAPETPSPTPTATYTPTKDPGFN